MTNLEEYILSKKNHHVVGVQYGDEGKGSITSKLIKLFINNRNVYINNIRYGGGMQVGHTSFDGTTYIENHGVPSGYHVATQLAYPEIKKINFYYTENCVINIDVLYNDLLFYKNKYKLSRSIKISYRSPVTTFLDVHENRIQNIITSHGSTGMGFGKTVERFEKVLHKFTLKDFFAELYNKESIIHKLIQIANYYRILVDEEFYSLADDFYDKLIYIYTNVVLVDNKDISFDILNSINIFEGHQGALLDKDSCDFPHVTRSKTTCILPINYFHNKLSDFDLSSSPIDIRTELYNYTKERTPLIHNTSFITHMVTRIYSTRHGNGPFKIDPIILKNNKNESNKFNDHQLEFKISKLNFDDLERGISYVIRDLSYNIISKVYTNEYVEIFKKNLILHVTCCDQVDLNYYYDTITKIENMKIIKDNNIKIKIHETNDFNIF